MTQQTERQGRTWVFGDNINTDLMYPNDAFRATAEERKYLAFRAIRPTWAHEVRDGDIIVAGSNFGTGSGRAAPRVLLDLGVRLIVAESVTGLFMRGSVNYALPAVECPGILSLVSEGDDIKVDLATGLVENLTTGQTRQAKPMPKLLIDLVDAGGVVPLLAREGYVEVG